MLIIKPTKQNHIMKFRIHFEIGEHQDHFDIEAETIEQVREIAKVEADKRGLDGNKNNLHSEQLS